MGFWLYDDTEAVAGFDPRKGAIRWGMFAVIPKYLINIDAGRHGKSPKKKPDHEDRASCGNAEW